MLHKNECTMKPELRIILLASVSCTVRMLGHFLTKQINNSACKFTKNNIHMPTYMYVSQASQLLFNVYCCSALLANLAVLGFVVSCSILH